MRISKSNMPNVHQSTILLCPLLINISGARYSGVPQKLVENPFPLTFVASPKSANRRYPSFVKRTFSGLRSRYIKSFS